MLESAFLMVMFFVLEIIVLNLWEKEIFNQLFYFTLFLRFTFMSICWIICFGTMEFGVQWRYDNKEYEVILPSRRE